MTNKEILKNKLTKYSKEQIIEAILLSAMATGFVLDKLDLLYGEIETKKKGGKNA